VKIGWYGVHYALMPCCALITTVYGQRAPDPEPAMASKKPDAQRRQARCIFAYHAAAWQCEGLRVVRQPAFVVTDAHEDARRRVGCHLQALVSGHRHWGWGDACGGLIPSISLLS